VTEVTVYGRPGCHLCDDATAVVREVQRRHPFSLRLVDIESDDALLVRYLERIPVVAVNGEELFTYFVDEDVLAETVARVSAP
jgi:glutaredoxin